VVTPVLEIPDGGQTYPQLGYLGDVKPKEYFDTLSSDDDKKIFSLLISKIKVVYKMEDEIYTKLDLYNPDVEDDSTDNKVFIFNLTDFYYYLKRL
jgi:hypothetical protein